MAKFRPYDFAQTKMIPISYAHQITPVSFEHTLSEVVDNLDLSIFNDRYNNDQKGAPAYDPALLLKVVLFAYSRGINTSRRIEKCCRENVIFMALSADTAFHKERCIYLSGG